MSRANLKNSSKLRPRPPALELPVSRSAEIATQTPGPQIEPLVIPKIEIEIEPKIEIEIEPKIETETEPLVIPKIEIEPEDVETVINPIIGIGGIRKPKKKLNLLVPRHLPAVPLFDTTDRIEELAKPRMVPFDATNAVGH